MSRSERSTTSRSLAKAAPRSEMGLCSGSAEVGPNRGSKYETLPPQAQGEPDGTYLRLVSWGEYSLSVVLDDDSRYILARPITTTMKLSDVTETLDRHSPRRPVRPECWRRPAVEGRRRLA